MDLYFDNSVDAVARTVIENKITILEGPDSSGKTTIVNSVKDKLAYETNLDVRIIRCPNNYGNARFRDIIMSEEIAKNSSAQAFLFMADFLYMFEELIKPYLDNDKIKFIFDRFLPSTCVYQKCSFTYMDAVFLDRHPDFCDVFSKARYIYLDPVDLETHKARVMKKSAVDLNHLDPKTDEEIIANIERYRLVCSMHMLSGLLGSTNASPLYIP